MTIPADIIAAYERRLAHGPSYKGISEDIARELNTPVDEVRDALCDYIRCGGAG